MSAAIAKNDIQIIPPNVPGPLENMLDTEEIARLDEIGQEAARGLESALKIASHMLWLNERPNVQKIPDGARGAVRLHFQGRMSPAWISNHWTVANRIMRFVQPENLLGCGWTSFEPLVQAAIWADRQKKFLPNTSQAELAARAVQEFSGLNRDEARAKNDGGKLDTNGEQMQARALPRDTTGLPGGSGTDPNALTGTQTAQAQYVPAGTYPVGTISRYESGVEHIKTTLETTGETLSPTMMLEFLGEFFRVAPPEIVTAMKRAVDTGTTGDVLVKQFITAALSEHGCDPNALTVIGGWLALGHQSRTLDMLAMKVINQKQKTEVLA